MNSDIDENQSDANKQPQKNDNKFDYILQAIIIIGSAIWIVWKGVQNNDPIVSTIWIIIVSIFAFWISNKLETDSGIFNRMIFGFIFISLLILSYLLYLLIKLAGLDLLQWTF